MTPTKLLIEPLSRFKQNGYYQLDGITYQNKAEFINRNIFEFVRSENIYKVLTIVKKILEKPNRKENNLYVKDHIEVLGLIDTSGSISVLTLFGERMLDEIRHLHE